MVAILFLLYWDKVGAFPTKTVGQILIAIAAFLTLLSMAYYLQAALPKLKRK
jgi:CDP-diacylglycerol--glycerol-3-phosphate 3-phosphatidyltransferase/cardiolipin synthase